MLEFFYLFFLKRRNCSSRVACNSICLFVLISAPCHREELRARCRGWPASECPHMVRLRRYTRGNPCVQTALKLNSPPSADSRQVRLQVRVLTGEIHGQGKRKRRQRVHQQVETAWWSNSRDVCLSLRCAAALRSATQACVNNES